MASMATCQELELQRAQLYQEEDVLGCGVLLQELLPVLHALTAGLRDSLRQQQQQDRQQQGQHIRSNRSSGEQQQGQQQQEGQGQDPSQHGCTPSPAADNTEPAGVQADASASPALLPGPAPQLPSDSCLLLLAASAQAVLAALSLRCGGKGCTECTSGSLCKSGASKAVNVMSLDAASVLDAMDAVLWLAHLLTSDGPTWEEVKAKHPLLAIEVLHRTAQVNSCRACGG
jgi:hypothetical protein